MGDIFGGGGGGGAGDTTDTKTRTYPTPAAIAAMRAAANSASGVAGLAKNLPHFAQIASSPSYRTALQDTANTWGDWMGQAPLDLSQGMAPITQGQFGSVIDAGQGMTDMIAKIQDPAIRNIISQWAGPGRITPGSPYDPIKYNPYISQLALGSKESDPTGMGGSGTIGAGGIPSAPAPAGGTPPPTGGTGTPPPTGGTGTPPPATTPPPTGTPPPPSQRRPGMSGTTANGTPWHINAQGQLVYGQSPGQSNQGGGRGMEGYAGRGGQIGNPPGPVNINPRTGPFGLW